MYNDLQTGDVLVTGNGGIYMISKFKESYMATTLDSDYIGTLCYYNEVYEDIIDLALAISAEENGIVRVVRKRSLKILFDNII